MGRIRQSISWWCFARDGVAPEELARTAKDIGYEAAELVAEDLWPIVKNAGLEIASICGHGTIENGLNRRENHDRIEAEILDNLRKAEQWGIPNLICFSGNRKGQDDYTGLEICAEGMRRVARQAEDAGVNLVVELLNSKVDHTDYQCDRTPWGARLCDLVGSPRAKLLYDIYHMQIMEGDVIRTVRDYGRYFGHYHTAGNPGRNDLDDTQELNYPPIMRAIAESGYDGYVGQEFVPRGDVSAALKAAFDTCNV